MALRKEFLCSILAAFCILTSTGAPAADLQKLSGHVPLATARLAPYGELEGYKRLKLAFGLPLRNQAELDQLISDLGNPKSPNYRHYLTPDQFTEKFGPTEKDYEAVAAFALAHGLTVTSRHPNRVILDISGTVADIEKALHIKMQVYRHPSESRDFYAPNADPSIDLPIRISHISGLNNYDIPHPNLHLKPESLAPRATQNAGTGPGGAYAGADFRAAYVPGTTLTGSGQAVALVQFDGYYPSDITAYRNQFGLPEIPLINVPIDGGVTTPGSGNSEVCLDIEMVMSMAPGLSAIYVYEAPNPSPWVDILSKVANDNLAKQVSCSWGGGSPNAAAEAIFQQMAAQGQSFFNATGDSDAFTGSIPFPSDSPNITEVGATTLTTSGPSGSYLSETVWNWGNGTGSSGGSSTYYKIPSWQQSLSMATNQGSATMRNVPDVALVGDNVYVKYNNGGAGTFGGTSCAAPLWAALTALINQQGTLHSSPPVGFLNPALYAIGTSESFSSILHDTTTGNNFSSSSPSKFSAVSGYDLCTGWGTPIGAELIKTLAGAPSPIITSGSSLPSGAKGTAYSVTLTATSGAAPYTWSITLGWLPSGLSLSPDGVLSGTPTETGMANFTVQATGTDGLFSTQDFSLAVYPKGTPIITTASPLASGTATYGYNTALAATGGMLPYTWASVSGNLPAGLTLSSDGIISGTPTETGTANFAVQVKGGDGLSSTTPFCISILPAPPSPVISSTSPLPPGVVGVTYSATLAASSGTPPYLWSVAPCALPSGLTLSSNGVISGTPTTTGTVNFTVKVTDQNNLSATGEFKIAISPAGTLLNGSFETGDFSGWIVSDLSSPLLSARVTGDGLSSGYGLFTSAATDGMYSAVHGFDGNGPGVIRIAQDIFVSPSTPFLTFDYRAGWDMQHYPGSSQPRTFAVTVQPGGGGSTLLNAVQLTAAPGSLNLDTGALNGAVDLSSFAGTVIRICFDANIPESYTGPGFFELDHIRLVKSIPLVITTGSSLPPGMVTTSYNQALSAIGGVSPYLWSFYSGNLPPGLTLNGNGLIAGTAQATGTFNFKATVTDSAGTSLTQSFILAITPPLLYSFPLNSNPGWSVGGQWAFGTPKGAGGTSSGNHDPSTGATGTCVYGVNLAGDYLTSTGGPYYLTAGPFNFSNCSGVKLKFQRWLNTFYQPYVAATVDVSTGGTTWTSVYKNPTGTPVFDSAWTPVQYDISSVADGHSGVYVRWGYAILQSGPPTCSGWNIDDIQFIGSGPLMQLKVPAGVSETSGTISAVLYFGRPVATSGTFSLGSSDPNVVKLPAKVVIQAGQSSATIPLAILNDPGLNGTRKVTITASAEGYPAQSQPLAIYDAQTAILSVSLPASIQEGKAIATGTVILSAPASSDVTVDLSSSNPSRLAMGAAVIRAGGTTGIFAINGIDNNRIDGTEAVTVTAHVANWVDGTATINVLDNETTSLALSVSGTLTEGDSPHIGHVIIPGTLTSDLVVSITSDNTDKIVVPATATISAGQTSGTFGITVLDNTIADGAQTVTLTATAPGFTGTSAQIVVNDNELDHLRIATIVSPQIRNAPFSVSISAYAIDDTVISNYSGTVKLSGSGASGLIPISPDSTGNFVNGVWIGIIAAGAFDGSAVLIASDGAGHTGTSNAFAVQVGSLDHFGFSTIPSPQIAGSPFAVTVTAQDRGNNTVADFNNPISLTSQVPVSPASTGNFTSGVWNGNVSLSQPAVGIMLSGSDSLGRSGTSNLFDVTSAAIMAVTPAGGLSPSGVVGGPFVSTSSTYTLSNTGTGWMTWTVSGSSAWLDFSPNGGTIASGSSMTVTATVNSNANALPVGSYSDTVSFTNATNGFGNTTRAAVLTIFPQPPVITSPLSATGTNGTPFVYKIAATNSPTSYGATGLPSGLALNSGTGTITGTPTVTGTSSVTISASNAGGTGSATLTLTILPPPPVISGTLAATGTCGAPFSYQVVASNSPTNYGASNLPSGLSINAASGLISGTPALTGSSKVTLTANNPGGTGSASLSLLIMPPPVPVISSSSVVTGTFGKAFSYQITATNQPTGFATSGLPSWLSLSSSTGLISGTATQVGLFSATISAANMTGTASANLTIEIPTLVAWGSNYDGETTVPAGLKNVISMAGYNFFSLALTSDGTVTGWGYYEGGQVLSNLNNVVSIAAGGLFGLALKSDGTVSSWGRDTSGETVVPSDLSHVVAISAGFYHSLALKSDGTVVGWGNITNIPVNLKNVVAISAGGYHDLALLSDGTVTAWGDGTYGDTTIPAGLNNVVAISAGFFHNLALKSDGTVVAWGYDLNGLTTVPAGLKDVVAIAAGPYHNLALKSDGTVVAWGGNYSAETNVPTGLKNVVAIDASGYHSMALVGIEPSNPAPVIVGSKMLVGAAQYPFYHRVMAKNSPTRYSAAGLPSGLGIEPSTGLITGTTSQSGTFNVVLSATNASGSGTSAVVLTLLPPPAPVITSPATASGTAGVPFSYRIAATHQPTSFGAFSLPSGLSVNTSTGLISGKPTQGGTFNTTINAANAGGTGSASLAISINSPVDNWKARVFTPAELLDPAISGDMACPAGDGIPNLIKYALNLDPKTNTRAGLPTAVPAQIGGTNYLTLTFTQVIAAPDITYTPEVSGDLQVWNSGDNYTQVVRVTDHPDGVTRSVTVRDVNPLNDSISRRFIRIKVTRP